MRDSSFLIHISTVTTLFINIVVGFFLHFEMLLFPLPVWSPFFLFLPIFCYLTSQRNNSSDLYIFYFFISLHITFIILVSSRIHWYICFRIVFVGDAPSAEIVLSSTNFSSCCFFLMIATRKFISTPNDQAGNTSFCINFINLFIKCLALLECWFLCCHDISLWYCCKSFLDCM